MRASRLLTLLFLLQTREQMTAQAMADALEVSLRTVYRDVDALNEAGVPVIALRGPTGGYQLLDGYRTRLTGLTKDEATALFLAGVPAAAASLGFGDVMDIAQLKLLAALPSPTRADAERLRRRFHLDATPWYRASDQPFQLAAVAAAVWQQRAILVHYQSWEGDVERRLEPLGIVQKGGVWYVVARAEQHMRTYRISNMQTLAVLEESFDWPADFDLVAHWHRWQERFEATLYRAEATVRLAPHTFTRLHDFFPPAVVEAAHTSAHAPDEQGWRTVVVPIESVEQAARDFLRLGMEVEVLAPYAVRQRIVDIVRQLLPMYDTREEAACPALELVL